MNKVFTISCPIPSTSQLSSSHLSSSPHLGASVPSISDYVYSQLSPAPVTSPEGKKIQQDICTVSQRGLRHTFMLCIRAVYYLTQALDTIGQDPRKVHRDTQ